MAAMACSVLAECEALQLIDIHKISDLRGVGEHDAKARIVGRLSTLIEDQGQCL
jgi:hypothetical protein